MLFLLFSMVLSGALLYLLRHFCLVKSFLKSCWNSLSQQLRYLSTYLTFVTVMSKILQKVETAFDSTRVSALDCILVAVWKNFWPDFSYILVDLCNMCLRDPISQIFSSFGVLSTIFEEKFDRIVQIACLCWSRQVVSTLLLKKIQ